MCQGQKKSSQQEAFNEFHTNITEGKSGATASV